ncbi:MAG: class I SAM-dependent methyltransferase [Patescibacteria group bacterium]
MQPCCSRLFDDRYGYPGYFDIQVCQHCGLYQTAPPLRENEIADLYTRYYPRQDMNAGNIKRNVVPEWGWFATAKQWFTGNHRIHFMLPRANKKVLEIGCGDGRSLLELKARGYDASGIETDKNVGAMAKELGLTVHIGTVENCDFAPVSFDYIIANQLIEHVVNLDSFLEHCKTLLKDNGTMIVSTPNARSIYRKLCGRAWINWHIPYHQQVFTKKSLALLLQKHGFSLTKTTIITPTAWTLHQLHALRTTHTMGIQDPYWNKKENSATGGSAPKTFMQKVARGAKRTFFWGIVAGITLVNRVVDAVRQGDCMVLHIQKR